MILPIANCLLSKASTISGLIKIIKSRNWIHSQIEGSADDMTHIHLVKPDYSRE